MQFWIVLKSFSNFKPLSTRFEPVRSLKHCPLNVTVPRQYGKCQELRIYQTCFWDRIDIYCPMSTTGLCLIALAFPVTFRIRNRIISWGIMAAETLILTFNARVCITINRTELNATFNSDELIFLLRSVENSVWIVPETLAMKFWVIWNKIRF